TEMVGLIDGKEVTLVKGQDEMFAGNWAHGFFKSKLSDFSDDTFNETADVALGEAWLDEYIKDGNGNNILIVRHPDIAAIIKDAIKTNTVKVESVPPQTIIKSQSGLVHHTQDEVGYRLYKKDRKGEWRPTLRHQPDNSLPFLRKKVQDVREKISTKSHIAYQEAVKRNDW